MILLKYISNYIKFLLFQLDHIVNNFFYTLYFFKSQNEWKLNFFFFNNQTFEAFEVLVKFD